jgi:hypothetical protein
LFGPRPQTTRVEIAAPPQTSDAQLRGMSYDEALRWAADPATGVLRSRERLERLAAVRNYDSWWIKRVANRHWREVLEGVRGYPSTEGGRETVAEDSE